MSGNPKQIPAGGQQMRHQTTYQPMQQTLPPRENFLANQNYVQQQPNQASTQGVALRGIAQTGPPNQAPTPPNQELKVQAVPQQPPMPSQPIYQQGRQFYSRPPQGIATGPIQNTRMTGNPHRTFQSTPHQFMQVPQNLYLNSMSYYNAAQAQRQSFVQPQVTLIQSQQYPAYHAFTPTQIQQTPQTVAYQYFPMVRPGPPPQPASTPSNPNQAPIATTIPLPQPVIPQQTMARQQKQRRPNAIAIIDPNTGEFSTKDDYSSTIQNQRRTNAQALIDPNMFSSKGDYNSTNRKQRRPNAIAIIDPTTGANMLDEMFDDNSHTPSGESSARQTPQPSHNPNKEVQSPFEKHYLGNEELMIEYDGVPPPTQVTERTDDYHEIYSIMAATTQPPPTSRNNAKFDHLAQTSTLKAHAKEFVLSSAKEPPVVSANCDSVEVTLNKLQKGRESPVKGRKPKDHHKESVKDIHPIKEVLQPEKQQIPVVKEETEVPVVKLKETSPPNNNQHSSKVTEKENDKRKKDNKSDNKQATETGLNATVKPILQNLEHDTTHGAPAKSKQNSNQKKDNHNKTNNQRPNPTNVPLPQPAKSNSKTIKKNELNSKGASKEGNDMDVFQISDAVNANLLSPATTTIPTTNNNDVINANAPVTDNVTPTPADQNAANDVATKFESYDVVPVKPTPEVKTTQKRWDVTNVFKGGRLPEPSPYLPSSTEINQDETDRSLVTNDRSAQAVNEPAAQVPTQVAEKKPDLPYREGQWSPFNMEGNKKYDKDFLMAVRNLPNARVKPANLPENLEYSEGSRQRDSNNRDMRFSSMGKDFTTPPFMPFGGKNSSMKGSSITKHPSLSGKMGNKGGKSVNGGNKISISLREDIKLHETENAWKPGRLAKAENKSDEDKKTEELYKKVRGVLNKLTPQKFDTLLNQIKALKVDTIERLQGVINLVFEKAIDEPSFAVAYAKMCMELAMMQVTRKTDDGKEEQLNFRKLLITRCQEEFEKQSLDEDDTIDKINAIAATTEDPIKKKEVADELEDYLRKLRRRSVGNVRFIGELFKINMLTSNIMTVCVTVLLKHRDEESLECLCRLLTTIGSKLEETKDLSPYFNEMQAIVDKKNKESKDTKDGKDTKNSKDTKNGKDNKDSKDGKDSKETKENKDVVSSRIRFMLQDVIDLRKNKWVPRRQDAGPKTIDQIAKDVATEQLNSQIFNSVPSTPRRDDRDITRGGKMRNNNQDEWHNHQKPTPFNLNKDKLKLDVPSGDEKFGQPTMFKIWNKGSTIKPPPVQTQAQTATSNRFSILENSNILDSDKKMSGGNGGGRYRDSAYHSKGSSLERGNYGRQNYDKRGGSRSGSQHRINDGAGPSGLTIAGPSSSMSRTPVPPQAVVKPPTPPPTTITPTMTEDQMKRFCKNCFEEYINDNCTFEECENDIRTKIPPTYMALMVSDAVLDILETSRTKRMKLGLLLGKLLASTTLPLNELCQALEDIFSQVEDLIIDIPTIWACLSEILVTIIIEGALPLSSLHKCCKELINIGLCDKMLLAIFKLIVCEKGPNYLKELWQSSKLKLTDFMPESLAANFIENNQLEFLNGGTPAQGNSELNYEQIEKKLLEFFDSNTPFDDICMWITANVGQRVEENLFIRTLATSIYKHSIVRTKLNPERLSKLSKLFSKYVDNNSTYELQCLYALQSLVNQLEHPQGLLLSIFNKLSEDSIFAQESFLSWENSVDASEQEGKGVALKQLTAFFTQLKENDDDEYVSTGSEEA